MTKYETLQSLVNDMAGDFEKFFIKGNKAAGTRVRKHMQDLKKIAS